MSGEVPKDLLQKVRKLAQIPQEARESPCGVAITRLTVLKSLCQKTGATGRFVTCLAQRAREQAEDKAKRPGSITEEEWRRQREMIDQAVTALEQYVKRPSEKERSRLRELLTEVAAEQDEHRPIPFGAVRLIRNRSLLLVEDALRTVLVSEAHAPRWAYQAARCYAEHWDSRHAETLTPASAPLVQDIVDFWIRELHLSTEQITMPAHSSKPRKSRSSVRAEKKKHQLTYRQGQFLAFIHQYSRLHRQAPAELDMVLYFRVTPPTVHSMVVKLTELGVITRQARVARSIRLAIPESEIPVLEPVEGPPWT